MSAPANPPAPPHPSPLGAPPVVYERHALGLPRGSVRAILTLMVMGLVWALLLLPEESRVPIPLYLYYLTFLILGSYFAHREHAARTADPTGAHPLYLPAGLLRGLIIVAFAGVIAWGVYQNPHYLERLKPSPSDLTDYPYLPLLLIGVFFLGIVINKLARVTLEGPRGLPSWYQDLLAWVSLLAMLGLAAEVVILLIVYPRLDPSQRIALPHWQGILSAIVAFYFGVRS